MHRISILALAVLMLLAMACRPRDTESTVRDTDPTPQSQAAELTFSSVRSLVEARRVKSVDELLPLLPEDFRSRFVLLKDSGSTQDASVRAPRVLMYTSNASLVVAFNGLSMQSGYEDLETYEFDATNGRFTFREIHFPAPDEADVVRFSIDNPPTCKSCHKAIPRPMFDAWPSWPSAMFTTDHTGSGLPMPEADKASFDDFVKHGAGVGRYKQLVGLAVHGETAHQERGDSANAFNRLMLAQIDRQLDVEILEHPRYATYQYAFDAAIAECPDLESYLKPKWRESYTMTYASLRQDTLARNAKASDTMIGLRWLFENHGITTLRWAPTPTAKFAFIRDASGDRPRLTRAHPALSCAELKAKSLASPDP